MAQLMSVRTNQDFGLDYKTNKLVPQTEVVIIVGKPSYKIKGKDIVRDTGIEEIRFKCGSVALSQLIGQLKLAQQNATHFDEMAGALNQIISSNPIPEGKPIEGE